MSLSVTSHKLATIAGLKVNRWYEVSSNSEVEMDAISKLIQMVRYKHFIDLKQFTVFWCRTSCILWLLIIELGTLKSIQEKG